MGTVQRCNRSAQAGASSAKALAGVTIVVEEYVKRRKEQCTQSILSAAAPPDCGPVCERLVIGG